MSDPATQQPPAEDRLVISRDDASTPEVEAALREREVVSSTKNHYDTASVRGRVKPKKPSLLRQAVVYLSVFGLLGGLIGWALGQALQFRTDPRETARELVTQRASLERQVADGSVAAESVEAALRELDTAGSRNAFYQLEVDTTLTAEARAARYAELNDAEERRRLIADLLMFAVAGACIAAALSAAEPAASGNRNMVIVNGVVGAVLGAIGGVLAGLLAEGIRDGLIGGEAVTPRDRVYILTQCLVWMTLGLFLAAAPGLVMRSPRRLMVGLAGGALGGLIGGFFYGPILQNTGSEFASRLVSLVAIGTLAGLATALVEDVIKDGWLKVLAGPIAGKQFVLYRDPTYIGSAPNSHIYLFNDKQVGRRHAAVHKAPGGYEIENLPLGGPTRVNGREVSRAKLLRGDEIEVGRTKFNFGEKPKS